MSSQWIFYPPSTRAETVTPAPRMNFYPSQNENEDSDNRNFFLLGNRASVMRNMPKIQRWMDNVHRCIERDDAKQGQ
ncbi:MAG: hypothetical protein MJ252_23095 [archaeon]|nr:hypothetical protein [archaeon]